VDERQGATEPVAGTAIEDAARHADLGIPPGPDTRARFLKRVVERSTRWFVKRQVAYNDAVLAALRDQQHVIEELRKRVDDLGTVWVAVEDIRADQRRELARWRSDHALVQVLLHSVRDGREPAEVLAELAEQPDDHDEFYAEFENIHRGTVELILDRLRAYLPDIEAVAPLGRIADLGTGRGEFLDLMAEAGIDAFGVDTNAVTVAQCRERGHDVVHDDALHLLRTLPDATLGAVTGFHIVEHVPFDQMLDLVAEALRVLAPGGILVFETPNPGNLMVGASDFYIDPTHLRPIPPPLLHTALWYRGFDPVEVRYVNASPPVLTLPDDMGDAEWLRPFLERLNEVLSRAPDYAVIGRRPPD
jgi:SAM-dependent methyltransferase